MAIRGRAAAGGSGQGAGPITLPAWPRDTILPPQPGKDPVVPAARPPAGWLRWHGWDLAQPRLLGGLRGGSRFWETIPYRTSRERSRGCQEGAALQDLGQGGQRSGATHEAQAGSWHRAHPR